MGAALVSGCSPNTGRRVCGVVLSEVGESTLKCPNVDTRELQTGADLPPHAVIETAVGARVFAALLPNALVAIGGSTKVEIIDLALLKDGDDTGAALRTRMARLRLHQGTLTGSHSRRDVAADPEFTIETGRGSVISHYDCVFRLSSESGCVRLTCEAGYVFFRASGSEEAVRIEPGYVGEWNAAATSFSPAEAIGPAQQTFAEILLEAQHLDLLLRERQRAQLLSLR